MSGWSNWYGCPSPHRRFLQLIIWNCRYRFSQIPLVRIVDGVQAFREKYVPRTAELTGAKDFRLNFHMIGLRLQV